MKTIYECLSNELLIHLFEYFSTDELFGLFYNLNDRWYAAGVVSYAIGCGRQAFPTVFTKTSAYINWIRSAINMPVST